MQTAVRYEQYAEAGSSVDQKLSIRYEPADWLAIRASGGTSYKAGQLAQNNLVNDTSLSFYWSYCYLNKALDASTQIGGLRPESANTFNVGAIVQQAGLFLTVDYWHLTLEDPIVTESFSEIIAGVCPDKMCNPSSVLVNRLTLNGENLAMSTTPVKLTAASLNRVAVSVINDEQLRTSGR